ncbi:MAG TPA: hypothetical protein VNN20_10110 [Thermodesulfobacteriota bacterium]|nr:hypothetical protein [Thermodesulfobacteriota bacterium]
MAEERKSHIAQKDEPAEGEKDIDKRVMDYWLTKREKKEVRKKKAKRKAK